MPTEPTLDQLLRTAIERTRLIRLRYQNRNRIVEPHDYAVSNAVTTPLSNWRWLNVDPISDAEILDKTFPGGRPIPSGKHHKWDQLFLSVKSSDGKSG